MGENMGRIGWLVDWWWVGSLVGWLIGCDGNGGEVDWLVDWLVGCLVGL